ncbi:MAG TPA: hypothetical protein PKM72_05655 [Nitrospirales bacterium]|nr:hypothetical protein [Nitrospirales bacterium]
MKIFSYFVIGFFISIWVSPIAEASEVRGTTNDLTEQAHQKELLTMVSGTVQDVQGDWCVVEDFEGTEWKIQVDKYTDTIGRVLPGVTIIAMVEGDGHAKKVKVLMNE